MIAKKEWVVSLLLALHFTFPANCRMHKHWAYIPAISLTRVGVWAMNATLDSKCPCQVHWWGPATFLGHSRIFFPLLTALQRDLHAAGFECISPQNSFFRDFRAVTFFSTYCLQLLPPWSTFSVVFFKLLLQLSFPPLFFYFILNLRIFDGQFSYVITS